MQLIQNGTQVASLPAPATAVGTPGYVNNAPPGPSNTPTIFDGDMGNAIIAELANTVLASGVSLSPGTFTQLLQSLRRMFGGNVTEISSTPGSALTADAAGLVVINATSGNITVTLPAVASANGKSLRFHFVRADLSGNTVSVDLQGGDLTTPANSAGPLSVVPGGELLLVGDGAAHWMDPVSPYATPADVSSAVSAEAAIRAAADALLAPLASPSLTGTPLAPTAGVNTSSTQIATTAFANPGASIANPGYVQLPSGLILQWGTTGAIAAGSSVNITFPLTFPNGLFALFPGIDGTGVGGTSVAHYYFTATSTSGITITSGQASNMTITNGSWFAIGW